MMGTVGTGGTMVKGCMVGMDGVAANGNGETVTLVKHLKPV